MKVKNHIRSAVATTIPTDKQQFVTNCSFIKVFSTCEDVQWRLSGIYVAVVRYIFDYVVQTFACKYFDIFRNSLRYSEQTFGKCQMTIFYMAGPKIFFKLALQDTHNVAQSWRRNAVPKMAKNHVWHCFRLILGVLIDLSCQKAQKIKTHMPI